MKVAEESEPSCMASMMARVMGRGHRLPTPTGPPVQPLLMSLRGSECERVVQTGTRGRNAPALGSCGCHPRSEHGSVARGMEHEEGSAEA